MTEPMRAYVVALSFADGLGIVQTVAPNAESAAAMVGVRAGRAHEGDPLAIAWAELTPEWLRMALRACETGKAGADVVSLVSDNPRPAEPPREGEPAVPVPRCIEHDHHIPCPKCYGIANRLWPDPA